MSDQLTAELSQSAETSLNAVEQQLPKGESSIQQNNEKPAESVQKPKKHWAEERIRKYAGKVHGLESELEKERREKAELRAELDNYKKSLAPKKPELSNYNDPAKYEQDMIEYVKSQIGNNDNTRNSQPENNTSNSDFDQREYRIAQEFESAVKEVSQNYPDLNDDDFNWVRTNPNLANAISEIRNSDPRKAAELAYYIASNTELSMDLEGASPYTIGLKLGQILPNISSNKQKEPEKKLTNATAPITPVSGNSAPIAFDYDKASAEDFIRRRNEEERTKRNRR